MYIVNKDIISKGIPFSELAAEHSEIFPSKGELRRTVKGGGTSINKEKIIDSEMIINDTFLINGKYLLVQKGKKNYYLIKVD